MHNSIVATDYLKGQLFGNNLSILVFPKVRHDSSFRQVLFSIIDLVSCASILLVL